MFKKMFSVFLSFVFITSIGVSSVVSGAADSLQSPEIRRYTREELREMYEQKYDEYFPGRNNFELEEDYDQSIIDEINNNILNNDLSVSDAELGILDIQTNDSVTIQNPEQSEYEIMSDDETQTYNGYVPAPTGKVFSKVYNANESVSLGSGALNYTYNILSIPGRNGLDLDISLRYNSADAIVPQSEFSSVSYPYWAHDYNKIATGWSYIAPSLFDVTEFSGLMGERFRFADGSTYALSPTYELEGYELDDVSLTREDGVYILTYSNGIKEYFENTYGTLVKREDRFGNEIVFEYETFSGNSGRKIHVPCRIIDTVGNTIDIDNDFITYNGRNYLSKMTFSICDTVYSTVNFDTFGCADISVCVIESIEDAEGNITTFEYIDMPNTKEHRFDERPNGRSVLLSKVTLPTGGVREYEYTKHMRSYNHYYYYSLEEFPHMYYEKHDVYKVSVIKDSDMRFIEYKYVGDMSGYPSSYPDTFHSEPKGYIHDEEAKYHTIVYDMDLYTVYTFDYKHNLISQISYTDPRLIPCYEDTVTQGVIVGNIIYQIGQYQGTKSYADPYSVSWETSQLSTPPAVENEGDLVSVKTHNKFIYSFFSSDDSYIAKEYNTTTDEWAVAGSTQRLQSDGNNLTPERFLYAGGVFYAVDGTDFLIYDPSKPVENRFERFSLPHNVDILTSHGEYIYYKSGTTVYKYNLLSKTAVQQYNISELYSGSKYDGFYTNDKLYIYRTLSPNTVYEVDFPDCTLSSIYLSNISAADLIKGYDGNMYWMNGYDDEMDMKCIYRFMPDSSSVWEIAKYRMFNDEDCSYLAGPNTIYIFHDVGLGRQELYGGSICNGIELVSLNREYNEWKKTTYEYNTFNQAVSKSDYVIHNDEITHLGTTSAEYVPGYNVISSSTDVEGNVTTYDYTDSTYFIPVSTTAYSGTSNELTTTNTLSSDKKKIVSTSTQYDDRSLTTEYIYSAQYPGNVISADILCSGIAISRNTYTYDNNGCFVTQTKALDLITNNADFEIEYMGDVVNSYTYDTFGRILTQTDAMGNTTEYTYDKIGRLTRTTYPDDTFMSKTYTISPSLNKIETSYNNQNYVDEYYDELGRIEEEYHSGEGHAIVGYKSYSYDYRGRIAFVTSGMGTQTGYFYDEYGRVIIVDIYNPWNPPDVISMTQFISYDDMNFKISESIGSNSKSSYYDIAGRKIRDEQETDAGLNFVNYEYDYMGNLIKTTDAKGNVTENTYDDMGQLILVEDAVGNETEYSYDLRGNVQQLKYNGLILSSNEYDNFGQLIKSTDNMGNSEYFTYDKLGNLIKYKDRNMNITTNEYDNMYRLTETQTGDMSVECTYDSLGSVLTMTDSTGTTSYSYLHANFVSSITTPDNKTISYLYNPDGSLYVMTDYDNNEYAYTYDQAGRIDTITKNGQLVADYTYRGSGSENGIQSIEYPEGTVNYTYDNAMRVTRQTNKLTDGTVIADYEYTYDIIGNQIRKKETINGTVKITDYEYDDINRLTSEISPDGTETTYMLDVWDNISAKFIIPPSDSQSASAQNEADNPNSSTGRALYYNYNGLNQLTSIEESLADEDNIYGGITITKTTTFTYDASGNMLTKRIVGQDDGDVVEYGYTYNPLNQLTEFEDADGNVTTYVYDGTGMRVSKTQGENVQKFYWDRGYIVNESLNGTFTASNSIGMQGIFARTTGSDENAQTDFLFKNAHGDVTDVVSNDELTNEYDYDAYGNQKGFSTTDTNPFRYSGEYYDSESGLIYLRNRYYDPEIERFITEDPIQDGMNWYAYCGNNPVMFTDPNGLIMGFYDDKAASRATEAMNQMCGYGDGNGYYIALNFDAESGNYSGYRIENGGGDFLRGSAYARILFDTAISDSVLINYEFGAYNGHSTSGMTYFYNDGKKILPMDYSKNKTSTGDRYATVNIKNAFECSIETLGLTLVHETMHGVAWNLKLDQNIHYIPSVSQPEQAIIHNYWQEAIAIDMQYIIANQLGDSYINDSTNKYYIKNNMYYHPDKITDGGLYGAYPMTYTSFFSNGSAHRAEYIGLPVIFDLLR